MAIAGYEHTYDFILLDMGELDVIIGMNWLTSFRAVIDCYAHSMTFVTAEGTRLQFLGDRLSTRRTDPLDALIASIWAEDTGAQRSVFPRVVREYVDVFPEELLGLPPHPEVESTIDIVPGTAPIALLCTAWHQPS